MDAGDLERLDERHVRIGADIQYPILPGGRIESIRPILPKENWFAAARV
jgi:hypothetical protein